MKNKTVKALKELLVIKDETIKELERQLALYKNQPPVVIQPVTIPLNPPYTPYTPFAPWLGPWSVSSAGTVDIPVDTNSGNNIVKISC